MLRIRDINLDRVVFFIMDDVKKLNRDAFLKRVMVRSGYPYETVRCIYDVILSEIEHSLLDGYQVSFVNFGRFYLTRHKGHRVQFGHDSNVEDYLVFRFHPSSTFTKRIREADRTLRRDGYGGVRVYD